MSTKQPKWKCIGHFGGCDPIAYGGGFVYIDETGVYAPKVTYFEPAPDDEWHKTEGQTPVTIYRFDIPHLKTVPYVHREVSGYRAAHGHTAFTFPHLVPAKYDPSWPHPVERYDEWFNTGDTCNAEDLARQMDVTVEEWQGYFCSDDVMVRAVAYVEIGYYAGFENLDSYPIQMSEDECYVRYAEEMKIAQRR